jgi:hypothetical protein
MFFSGPHRAAHVRRNKQAANYKACRGQASNCRTLRIEGLEHRNLLSLTVPGYATPDYVAYVAPNSVSPLSTAGPTGYTPAQIRQAYGINQITFNNGTVTGDGSGMTIAIVDAYDDPNIANDLHQFDLKFGIPDTTLTKVNETGGTALPTANAGWITEIALDVEWAHAIAPGAKILLVEANSASYSDLLTAVKYAASASGVVAVSMSWGGGEFSSESTYDSYFTTPSGHTGVTFVASSGDSGSPVGYPAISPNVLSVGGTTLNLSQGNYGSESAWSDSGGGISAYESQPSYQKGIVTQSTVYRTNPDVAYDSNPSTGFPVYDSYNNPTSSPWGQWGGTSDAAPQWAALIAIADQGRALAGKTSLDGATQTLPMLYALPSSDFHDTTSGTSVGRPNYSASTGYDLVTGRGTPYANLVVAALVGSSTSTSTTATHFSVTATSTTGATLTTATAGSSFNITVTALDSGNNVVKGYTGAVHFSSSDSLAVADGFLPADYTFTSSNNGIHTFTVTLATAGSQSITATDKASASLLGNATVTVTPGVVDHLAFGQQPTSVAPGMVISPAVTVRLLDHYNNLVIGDNTDQVTIAIATNPGNGVLSGAATATASGGVAAFSNLAISQPGSGYTLRAAIGSSMTATSASFNVATATSSVIESFDGSRNYSVVGGSLTASLSTAAKHDGTYGLVDLPGNDWIYRNDAAVQVKQGDTISVWLQFSGNADGRAYFGFGASSAGTLSLVAAPNTNQLLIQNNNGWGYTNIGAVNQTWQVNHWYRLEIDWGTSGKIVGKLFDSNGTTLLQTVTASTSVITSGGIAFRATGNYNKFWDTVTATPGVNQFVQPVAAAVPAIDQYAALHNTVAGLPAAYSRARVQVPDSHRRALETWFAAFGAGSQATNPTSTHHSELSLDGIFAQLHSGRVIRDP